MGGNGPLAQLNEGFVAAVDALVDGIQEVQGKSQELRFLSENPFPVDSLYLDLLRPLVRLSFQGRLHPVTVLVERHEAGARIVLRSEQPFPSSTSGRLEIGDLRSLDFVTPNFRRRGT